MSRLGATKGGSKWRQRTVSCLCCRWSGHLNVIFERIAVTGRPGDNTETILNPEFKDFNEYDMAAQPGQEVFVEAKPTGGQKTVNAMHLETGFCIVCLPVAGSY